MVMKPGIDIWGQTSKTNMTSYVGSLTQNPSLKHLGAQYIRLEFNNTSLPSLRQTVPVLVSNGFQILGLLMEKSYAPSNVSGWGTWVQSVVNEFKSYVHVWECWNEPNQAATFFNGGTVQQYTAFLKECWTRAKSADSTCKVLGGAVAFTHATAINYGRQIYQGTSDRSDHYMDGLAWHPYCNPYAPEDTVSTPNPYVYLTRVRDMMAEFGDTRPIWITELGWQSNSPSTEQQQSQNIVRALEIAYGWGWVELYILYRWKDSSGDSRLMGLLNTSLQAKPAYSAVRDFIWNYIPPPPPPVYTCTICGATFSSQAELDAHTASAHPPAPVFTCPYCAETFASQEALDAHISFAHPPPPVFTCSKCGATFNSQAELDVHMTDAHPPEEPEQNFFLAFVSLVRSVRDCLDSWLGEYA